MQCNAALWDDHFVNCQSRERRLPSAARRHGLRQSPAKPVSVERPVSVPRTSQRRRSRAVPTVCWRRHRVLPRWPKNDPHRDRFAVSGYITMNEYSRPASRRRHPQPSPVFPRCSVLPSKVCTTPVTHWRMQVLLICRAFLQLRRRLVPPSTIRDPTTSVTALEQVVRMRRQ